MVEAVMFWNEPNNKSHWDFEIDPDWKILPKLPPANHVECWPSMDQTSGTDM